MSKRAIGDASRFIVAPDSAVHCGSDTFLRPPHHAPSLIWPNAEHDNMDSRRLTLAYKKLQDGEIFLDIYFPISSTRKPPAALVYFHGGGLTVGNKRSWFPTWMHSTPCEVVSHNHACLTSYRNFRTIAGRWICFRCSGL